MYNIPLIGICMINKGFTVFSEPDHGNGSKCPATWRSFGLRCYKYFSDASNWITAEVMCYNKRTDDTLYFRGL